ncbi:MAG: glycosyltransferase [Alistipes sp.]
MECTANRLISIIIPVYNAEQQLSQCIDSVLRQSLSDFELLLVDDGSTDRSGEICDQYALQDARIKVFHQPNGGVSAARNRGLDNAQGEFVVFIDADDWVESNHLQQFIDCAPQRDGIVFSGLTRHTAQGETRCAFAPVEAQAANCIDSLVQLRRQDVLGWTWNKLFSRGLIELHNIRFDTTLSFREDELFTAHYCRYINHLTINSSTTYHYRMLPSGLTRRKLSSGQILHFANALYDAFSQLGDHKENLYLAARLYLSQSCRALRMATNHSEAIAARREVLKAWGEYKNNKNKEFLTDCRDRKVAARSRWVFRVGGSHLGRLRLLVKLINI